MAEIIGRMSMIEDVINSTTIPVRLNRFGMLFSLSKAM